MSALRLVLAACAALAVAACAIGRPAPVTTTYVIKPPPPSVGTATRHPQAMRMGNVRVAPQFAGNELVYRVGDVQFTSDFYNAFIAEPGPMLGAGMAEWLDHAGPFKTVSQPGGVVSAPYALEAVATELYGDFRPGQPPTAVMTVQFTLLDLRGPSPTVVFERFISRQIALPAATPDALVRGYGQALAEILTELQTQLSQVSAG